MRSSRKVERSRELHRVLSVVMQAAMKPGDETLRTSWTLVAQLKNLDDHVHWQEFYELYRGLILGVARKAGLRDDEAEVVLQETMTSVSRNIGGFEANPSLGSFHSWLLTLARWRVMDQLKRRLPLACVDSPPTSSSATPHVERIPDPREADLIHLCDAEWRSQLLEKAMKQLQVRISADAFQVFHLITVQQKSAAEAAQLLGKSRAQIYLMRHRAGLALKKIVRELEKRLG